MLKNLLILPDGTELFSGSGTVNAIKNVKLTQCVNSSEDLMIGSTCASMIEAELFTPGGNLSLKPGDEVALYKVDGMGTRKRVGDFILEKPVQPSANTMRITGYDRVVRLDKDLTEWVKSLNGWPYTPLTFAEMVCEACGVEFAQSDILNADYQITAFSKNGVTGRQIMKWVGELCCRFCRANAYGQIEFGWYTPLSGLSIGYKGQMYKGLSFSQYAIAPIDAVQIAFAEDSDGYRWPAQVEDANCYVISGNPFLNSTNDIVANALRVIQNQLQGITYTPCTVEVPASLEVCAGHIVTILDKNGVTITAYVMTKTTKGQKDILECTGNHRRDSTSAVNNASTAQQAQTKDMVDKLDKKLTQYEILQRLTAYGGDDAIWLKDGKLAIKASAILTGILKGIEIIGEKGKIGGFTMSDKTLSVEWRTGYGPYTSDDLATIEAIYRSGSATQEQVYRYDVNMNGRIDSGDTVAISGMIAGTIPAYSVGRITLDSSNLADGILLEITEGYRAGEKTILGLGGLQTCSVAADKYYCGNKAGYTGTVTIGGTTLTISGGIITGIA